MKTKRSEIDEILMQTFSLQITIRTWESLSVNEYEKWRT